jgi:hypothetical protein
MSDIALLDECPALHSALRELALPSGNGGTDLRVGSARQAPLKTRGIAAISGK